MGNTVDNPIASIPNEHLTHELWKKAKEKAKAERDWEIADHQRLAVLAEITSWYEGSHTASEAKARRSEEYQEFLAKRAEIKQTLILARAKYDAIKLEINLRINKSFTERADYQSGKVVT